MPTTQIQVVKTEEVEIDSDYCYQKAAEALISTPYSQNGSCENAKEWRLLGDSLAAAEAEEFWRFVLCEEVDG